MVEIPIVMHNASIASRFYTFALVDLVLLQVNSLTVQKSLMRENKKRYNFISSESHTTSKQAVAMFFMVIIVFNHGKTGCLCETIQLLWSRTFGIYSSTWQLRRRCSILCCNAVERIRIKLIIFLAMCI